MPVKTITITEKAYTELKNLKREKESFSELIIRLANQTNGDKLMKYSGAWDISDKEFESIEKKMATIKNYNYTPRVNFD